MGRFLRKVSKAFRHGQRGFTLIELLIVVAILGILAAVLVPNLIGFLTTGKVAAANTEVATVETAALAYYSDNDGNFPADSDGLFGLGYINADPKVTYTFDDFGKVEYTDGDAWGTTDTVIWDEANHKWVKG